MMQQAFHSPRMKEYTEALQVYLDQSLSLRGEPYDPVIEAMRYSVMNAGKRLRPVLVLEFCRMYGGDWKAALPLACAVELIHCYSLIHDDLPCMDDDDLRRGKPSCHKVYGEAIALLAGDALLTKAFELLSMHDGWAKEHPAEALQCVQCLAQLAGTHGMVGGQTIDLSYEQKPIPEAHLWQLHRLKTAALIQASCMIGTYAAQAGEESVQKAKAYGESMGLAFQIIDDILDVEGQQELLGKTIGSDAQKQKTTFVTLHGMEQAKQTAASLTDQALTILQELPEHTFMTELTKQLLHRQW